MDDFFLSNSYSQDWQTQNEVPFNEELFLKNICNFPVIYDSSKKGYSNRLLTDRAWDHISRSMDVSVEICKKKWKSLREKYLREKQKLDNLTRSGAGAFFNTPWPHMSFFQYMLDSRQPRETISSALDNSEEQTSPGNPPTYSSNRQPFPLGPEVLENVDYEESKTLNLPSTSRGPTTQNSKVNILQNLNISTNTSQSENKNQTKQFKMPPLKYDKNPLTATPDNTSKAKKRKVLNENNDIAEDSIVNILGKISTSMEQVIPAATLDKLNTFSSYLVAELRDLPTPAQEEFIDQTMIRLLQLKQKQKKNTPI